MNLSVRLAVAAFWLAPILAGGTEFPRVKQYSLDMTFSPAQQAARGAATVWFDPAEPVPPAVTFFLHGELEVDSILQGGRALEFEQAPEFYARDYSLVAKRVRVTLVSTEPAEPLAVFYGGYFHASAARSGSDYMRIDSSGVYLRAHGYSLWFPVFLDDSMPAYPVTFPEVKLRTPAEMTAVFVGHRVDERLDGDERVSTWQAEDVMLYYPQCTARRFQRLTEGALTAYYWDDTASTRAAASILKFVRDVAGEFGERYRRTAEVSEHHVMEMPEYGDISSDNVTGMICSTWRQFDDEQYPRRHLAHELVHPFVQVPIDLGDPLYALVIEGFPSYFHLPVIEKTMGQTWYDEYLARVEKGYLEKKRTGKSRRGDDLPPEKPIDRIGAEEVGDYKDCFILSDRALLFLHFLRRRMGDEGFVAFGRELFDSPSLSDERFRKLVAKHLPDLGDDLRLWLSTGDYPERFRFRSLAASE